MQQIAKMAAIVSSPGLINQKVNRMIAAPGNRQEPGVQAIYLLGSYKKKNGRKNSDT